jgi:hypothetical protein
VPRLVYQILFAIRRPSVPQLLVAAVGGAMPGSAFIKGPSAVVSTRPALSRPSTLAAITVSVLAPFALGYFLSYLFRW